jgi:metal-responsive CopG/Arc/MetJ family transcriptional regulator
MHAIRTTVTLPADLVDAADQAVRAGKARSRNDLLVMALRHELAAQERMDVDADLAAMADDPELQAEAELIEREFAQADSSASAGPFRHRR